MATTTCQHSRENTGILASIERRVLHWIAVRLPEAVTSDHLSALGLASMFVTGIGFAALRWTPWAAAVVVVALAVNWFGDSLDGTVARVRGLERPRFGFYVDHVIDLAGTALLFGGLACSGLMNPLLAMALLAAYLMVCAETYLATHARRVFRMSFLGVGPTELRVLLALGAMKVTSGAWIHVGDVVSIRLFDVGALVAIPALAATFVVSAIANTAALYRDEPVPSRPHRSRAA
jgi:phosphatidylglycerophosphate synthase